MDADGQLLVDFHDLAHVAVLPVGGRAALDGPLLLYLSADDLAEPAPRTAERIARAWHDLIRRACRP